MATKTQFRCSACGTTYPKWAGKCSAPSCQEWGTIEEVDNLVASASTALSKPGGQARLAKATTGAKPLPVSAIQANDTTERRLPTNIGEFDRVLGGGIVNGAAILLAGQPGAGKSTILAMVAQAIAVQNKKVLYISGEENATQIASRSIRVGADSENILIMSESNLDNAIEALIDEKPALAIVDSIQTMVSGNSEGKVGSPSQVVEVANDFTTIAKRLNIPVILIGHITKDGNIAGPRTVEHLVDVVLYLEASSDTTLRLLRGIKNRYGATDEIGCFEHSETGLLEISDPSGFFTNPHSSDVTGYATSVLIEGQRALPIEVQALVTPSPLPNPRKISHGLDHARCLMIQAILEKYAGLKLGEKDVYVSTTGGMTVKDSSIDLAVAAAIMSSYRDLPPSENSVFLGELSLTGELRRARFNDKRRREAERLGFTNVYDDSRIGSIKELITMFDEKR